MEIVHCSEHSYWLDDKSIIYEKKLLQLFNCKRRDWIKNIIVSVEEGRGKKKEVKKKLKILVPLLILAKAKAVAIVVAAIVIIAASIFKIAVLAKIAFIAKAIAIIKHLIHKKHEEEHTWVPHHEEHVAPGWEGGWSRSRNDANNLAYSAYSS